MDRKGNIYFSHIEPDFKIANLENNSGDQVLKAAMEWIKENK